MKDSISWATLEYIFAIFCFLFAITFFVLGKTELGINIMTLAYIISVSVDIKKMKNK